MEIVTHAVLGAALAHATEGPRNTLGTRGRCAIGAAAAVFPDLDFALFLLDPLHFLAYWHQAPTHSLVLLPVWAALIGGVVAALSGRRSAFPEAACVSALALASHIASDLITAYGTAIFHPLSQRRFGLGITNLIDPLFTTIISAGLLMALLTNRRWPASAGLAALGLYVGTQALLQQRAIELAQDSARTQGVVFERMVALAQPFSPFNWKLIAVDGMRFHEAYANIAGHRPPPFLPAPLADIAAAYRPPDELQWQTRHRFGNAPETRALAMERWADPRFAPFRHFAVFPAVSRIDKHCVWFTDLRYDLPDLPDTFRYGFCRDSESGVWKLYRLRYFSDAARQPVGQPPLTAVTQPAVPPR